MWSTCTDHGDLAAKGVSFVNPLLFVNCRPRSPSDTRAALVTPTILFNLILSIIGAMQTFVQPYVMTEGGPNNASLLYVLYLYNKAFQQSQMGYASALAWVLFVVIAVLSLIVFRTSSRWVHYAGR